MKAFAIIVVVLILGLFLWMRFRTSFPTGALQPGSAPEYLSLRNRALELPPAEIGLALDAPTTGTWAAIMEIYMESSNSVVTVTSFIDGNASIYLSRGGGYIGGFGKPKIHDAAIAFVKAAEEHESQMTTTEKFPFPKAGETIFYVRSGDRTYRASAPTDELDATRHPLSKLWSAGQEVITQYRLDSSSK
jgi:hypothetical protein